MSRIGEGDLLAVNDVFAAEDAYADIDGPGALNRLATMLSFPTVSTGDRTSEVDGRFDEMRAWMAGAYPHVFSEGTVELVDAAGTGRRNLLITVEGTDPSLAPLALLAHQDVVGVVPGTGEDWTHGAFKGTVDRGFVWGRGAIDMKVQLAGILEALEGLLAQGGRPRRTVVVASGADEETGQTGARALGELLAARGVHPLMVVDEGDYLVRDGAPFGAPGFRYLAVNVAEKGYADVAFHCASEGGHSSVPGKGTSLAVLARALVAVEAVGGAPRLTEPVARLLAGLAPHITQGPLRGLLSEDPGELMAQGDVIARILAEDPELAPLVVTTVAPTMMVGGSDSPNILPQSMTAVVNFRLLPGDSLEALLARVAEAVAGLPVEVELLRGANEPSHISRSDGEGMALLQEVASRFFRTADGPIPLLPTLALGASDARMYEGVSDQVLRFSAFVSDDDEVALGVHGTDERIGCRAFLQGVRFYRGLLEES